MICDNFRLAQEFNTSGSSSTEIIWKNHSEFYHSWSRKCVIERPFRNGCPSFVCTSCPNKILSRCAPNCPELSFSGAQHTPYFASINMSFLLTHFCAKDIFKVPVSNTFPTPERVIPKDVKFLGLTKSFPKFCTFMPNTFPNSKLFSIHHVCCLKVHEVKDPWVDIFLRLNES